MINTNEIKRFVKFGLVGVSNTVISLGIYYIFIFVNKSLYLIGYFTGFIVSVANSYFWNNRYVFGGKGSIKKLLKTYLSYGFTNLLSMVLLYILVDYLSVDEGVAPLITMVVTVPLNYLINKKWTFKNE